MPFCGELRLTRDDLPFVTGIIECADWHCVGGDPLKLRYFLSAATTAAAFLTVPAVAGETVLYGPAPSWVVPADFAAAQATGETLVLIDEQARMEGGTVATFTDVAYRIDNPEALTKAGTLQLGWMPDKGDLTVHRLEIYRDGKPLDLVAQGVKYTVLRRETALEKRSLNGALTATVAVPGLKVGDVLRFSQTITTRDQALGEAMQFGDQLPALPNKVGFGRIAASWPASAPMAWRAGPDVTLPPPVEAGGYKTLTALLPIAKRNDQPENAPARFTLPPLMQVASFADWRDVSRRMAPHFGTEGAIAPGSPLAAQVAAIAARSADPRARAAAALQLVQDDVAYLLNGMNGGNYLPQSVSDTWANRYGDCKAKSLLLLAMLRAMNIESEAVLVRTKTGDALSELLPMAAAFDHMIVRASIDGRDYWLDGTDLGIRLDTLEEVPPFFYALPLRPGGADLMPVTQRWPSAKDRITTVTYDYRAGVDMPVLYEAKVEMRGQMAIAVRAQADNKDPQARLAYAEQVLDDLVGDGVVYQARLAYDEANGVGTVTAKGLLGSGFEFERGRGKLSLNLPSTGLAFAPDRARAAWKSIPYAVGGPFGSAMDMTVLLPEDGGALDLGGLGNFEGEAAGTRVRRNSTLVPGKLHIVDEAVRVPAEIPVAEFAAQRAAVSRLNAGDPVLRTSAAPVRYWMLDPAVARKRIAALQPAYDAIIALDPAQAWRYSNRAKLFQLGPDLKRALADHDKAIALEPDAESYAQRSALRMELGDLPGALADAREAYALEATAGYARSVASLLARQGKGGEALAVLEPFDLAGDERVNLMLARAELMGEGGKADEGWALLEEAAGERPGDAGVLNAQCWFMGNWSYRLDSADELCDRAVKAGSYNAGVLDSRALVHYRRGQRQEAMSDLQAALADNPGQSTSLYLRGLIAIEDGKQVEGERDIAAATRLYGGIAAYFARFGLKSGK